LLSNRLKLYKTGHYKHSVMWHIFRYQGAMTPDGLWGDNVLTKNKKL
jgi:hypothetical protein